ncbi:S8 family serine peptidase [Stigmatella erecta]|uniref:Serine protease, subtilisin family n=1 Tax=Stigmatella erecta TaxID=83460 RepID=A0A1I0FZF8_9BACT|nr:S8 family serine peptidase [Stigmatella erecta]SET63932.1 Serine protease, subtilisin family [Stigmatella erecta]
MKQITKAACTLSFLVLGACGAEMQEQEGSPSETKEQVGEMAQLLRSSRAVPNRYIVVLKKDLKTVSLAAEGEIAQQMVQKTGGEVLHTYKSAINGFAARMSEAQVRELLADPRVAYIEEDSFVEAVGTQTGATWGIDRIDQTSLPLNSTYNYNNDGTGVHAYIVDTGVLTTHTEFTGRIGNGYDAVTAGGAATDCNGHGSHVAGTVGGTVYGVAKKVTIHPVRVLDCNGSGTTAGVIAGVDWVKNNHIKPAVANMSLGGGASQTLDDAVAGAITAGVVFAVAAGNDNGNACSYSPARTPSAITVGATERTDARASYSNYGTCLDIFAPGSSITSAWYTSTTGTNTISGTSMASPHVAGAAALYLAANPSATPQQVRDALVNNGTAGKVTSPGTNSPNVLLYTGFIGGGGPNPGDTTPPSTSITSPAGGASLSGSVTLSADASDNVGVTQVEFYAGSLLIGTDSSAPYSISWDTASVANGSYALTSKAFDASGNSASSAAVSVSVSNTTGSCSTTQQLLSNPGFESGATGWTTTSGVIDGTTDGSAARTGTYKAWLNGYGTAKTDSAYQQISIPATACSASLSFWVKITTKETTTTKVYDTLAIQIRDSANAVKATLATYSNLDKSTAYAQKTFDLSAYKGQTLRVYFNGVEDSSQSTSFFVDDTALTITR